MIPRLSSTLFIVVTLVSGEVKALEIPDEPQEAARVFYTELRRLGGSGIPEEEEWAALAPRVTKEFANVIAIAQKEQADFIKNNPDEKPPWVDGDLFSSLFEGPQSFTFGQAITDGDRSEVRVSCVHEANGEKAEWGDFILLKKTAKGWLVDDIRYGGEWMTETIGAADTLKEALGNPEE